MKKIFLLSLAIVFCLAGSAQEADTVIQEIDEVPALEDMFVKELPAFNALDIKGSKVVVSIEQSDYQEVKFVNNADHIEKIELEVINKVLSISTKKISDPVEIFIKTPGLVAISCSHIARVKTLNTLQADNFILKTQGTSEITLMLETDILETDLSGAAELKLKGSADVHKLVVSGAAEIDASDFITDETEIDISGAGDAKINAEDKIYGEISGAAELQFIGEPNVDDVKVTGAAVIKGKSKKDFVMGKDTMDLKIGGYKFKITEDDDKEVKKKKKRNNTELWSGFDLGVNGYLNSNNELDMPAGYDYMDLNYAKAIGVGFNLFEQDIPVIRNYVELVTGMGFEINNYKFSNNTFIENHPTQFSGYIDSVNTFTKSKLRVSYLTVPLLLEINTSTHADKGFHFAGGLLFGYNIGAKTKVEYEVNGKKEKSNDGNNFFIEPFRYGLTARIGYGDGVMLFANYALTNLFKENKGPELYPFTIGVSFVGI